MADQQQLELPVSSAGEMDVNDQANEGQVEASSSDAHGDDEGLLAVVRDAVEKTAEEEDTDGSKLVSPTNDGDVTDGSDADDENSEGDKSEDDYSDTPFHKHQSYDVSEYNNCCKSEMYKDS